LVGQIALSLSKLHCTFTAWGMFYKPYKLYLEGYRLIKLFENAGFITTLV